MFPGNVETSNCEFSNTIERGIVLLRGEEEFFSQGHKLRSCMYAGCKKKGIVGTPYNYEMFSCNFSRRYLYEKHAIKSISINSSLLLFKSRNFQ